MNLGSDDTGITNGIALVVNGTTGFPTDNNFYGVKFLTVNNIGIDIQGGDTNRFYDVFMGSGANNATGVRFNTSTTVDNDVHEETFFGIAWSGSNNTGTTGLLINYAYNLRVYDWRYDGPSATEVTVAGPAATVSYVIDETVGNNLGLKAYNVVGWPSTFTAAIANGANAQIVPGFRAVVHISEETTGTAAEYIISSAGAAAGTSVVIPASVFIAPTSTPADGRISVDHNGSTG